MLGPLIFTSRCVVSTQDAFIEHTSSFLLKFYLVEIVSCGCTPYALLMVIEVRVVIRHAQARIYLSLV